VSARRLSRTRRLRTLAVSMATWPALVLALGLVAVAGVSDHRRREEKIERIVVEDLDPSELDEFISDHEYAAVVFYSTLGGSASAADRVKSRWGQHAITLANLVGV